MDEKICRREFLNTASIGVGTFMLPAGLMSGCGFSGQTAKPGKIALQLYTLRNEIKIDAAGTLQRLSEIGYKAVETAFWPEHITIKDAGKLLEDAGLSVCSSHCELPIGNKKAEMLEIAETFNSSKMIWHGWPEDERYKTQDGIKQLADIYNEANLFAKSNGLQFGIHNHWWEFKNRIDDRFAYQVLLDYVEDDIFFEIDTYWVKVAGHDPANVVKTFGKRASLLHIKDGPARWTDSIATNPEPMVAVGKGTQDFPGIVKAAQGNTEWMVVEIDACATDMFTAIGESFNYLTENALAEGFARV